MKKGIILAFLVLNSWCLYAQNEIGPEGHKLLWVLFFLLAVIAALMIYAKLFDKKVKTEKSSPMQFRKLNIRLEKNAKYYPDILILTVKNTSAKAIDIEQPLLVFDNFWLKRKFRIKGTNSHSFYPLFLEEGKTHEISIDLTRFYSHDKSLKKFPKLKIYLSDVKGKKLGSKAVFLRKTLVRF